MKAKSKVLLGLVVLLAMMIFAAPAMAQDNETANTLAASGKCGDNLTWSIDGSGTLTISGTGEMYDFSNTLGSENPSPWRDQAGSIKKIVIEEGVTSIGKNAFGSSTFLEYSGQSDYYACTTIEMPSTLKKIGETAFSYCTNITGMTIPDSVESIGYCALVYDFKVNNYIPNVNIPEKFKSGKCGSNATWRYADGTLTISGTGKVYDYSKRGPDDTSGREKDSVYRVYTPWSSLGNFSNGIKTVVVDEGITRIDGLAYLGTAVKDIYLPKSMANFDLYEVGVYQYEANNRDITLHGYKGSCVETFANEKKMKFVAIEDKTDKAVITAPATLSVEAGKTAAIGASVSSAADGGVMTYQSADTKIATVDNKGNVTGVAEGKTTITINSAATQKYQAADPKTVTVTVTKKASTEQAIAYRTHVENVGWQPYVTNGTMAGTSHQALRLEAMNINLQHQKYTGDIEYRTHIENIGWESEWKKNDTMSGTSQRALRLEAMQVRLTGEMAKHYDVYYRVHAENFGWLGWAKNGEQSGTAGYAYRLEAMQIMLVDKGGAAPSIAPTSQTDKPFLEKYKDNVKADSLIAYQTHVENVGWQNYAVDGGSAGTSHQALRLEGMKIELNNPKYTGDIEYRTHIQNIGWENEWKKNNAMSGTSGRSYRLEAMQVRLTGEMAQHYDVYYRVHAENFGWLGWAKNGEESGTAGYAYRLEAMQIVLVNKGGAAPNISPASDDSRAFIDKNAQPVQPVEPDKPSSDRAVLDTGGNVNIAMRQLSGQNVNSIFLVTNTTIKAILRSNSLAPSGVTTKNLSITSVPVTAWWDASSQTIYWYSEDPKPMLNANSSSMFGNLTGVTDLDLSTFDTSKVTNMNDMFYECCSLTDLDVSHFNTSKVTDMYSMFSGCHSLADLNLSSFDTSKVTDMSSMFYGCSSLTSLDVTHFDTSKVTNMCAMFINCSNLTRLDVTNFDTSKVTDMSGMFQGCRSLTSLDLSNFDTSKVTVMANMFYYCNKLKTIYVSDKFTTQSVNSNWWMFSDCSALVGGKGTTYDDNHRDKEYARIDKPGQPGYFTQK